jgi:hypothetical protein
MVFLRKATNRIGRDMPLEELITAAWSHIQGNLFPWLEAEVGPLTDTHKRLVTVLEMVRVEAFIAMPTSARGRPEKDRPALARAFIAKAVLNLATTRMLIDRLTVDTVLRRLCGWERSSGLPSEATFSRAYDEFAACGLPARVHAALIARTHKDRLVGHISRDSTAIEAREQPSRTAKRQRPGPKRKRGRPKKGEIVPEMPPRRLVLQATQSLSEMLADLPTHCSIGTKRSAKGQTVSWVGYKLHIDTADGDIPISCVLTSASLNDSQVAIPLATITARRVTNLYDLMDSAYDIQEIYDKSRALGHVPIIDHKTLRGEKDAVAAEARAQRRAGFTPAEDVRYNQRSSAERVNASLKDNCGGKTVHVRGAAKVFCHLMFGILVVTVEQVMRLVT